MSLLKKVSIALNPLEETLANRFLSAFYSLCLRWRFGDTQKGGNIADSHIIYFSEWSQLLKEKVFLKSLIIKSRTGTIYSN
jgi:hypothetical protein